MDDGSVGPGGGNSDDCGLDNDLVADDCGWRCRFCNCRVDIFSKVGILGDNDTVGDDGDVLDVVVSGVLMLMSWAKLNILD